MLNPIGATDSGSKPLLAVAQGLGSKGFLENYGFYAAHSEIRKWLSVERLGGFVKELFGTYLAPNAALSARAHGNVPSDIGQWFVYALKAFSCLGCGRGSRPPHPLF